MFGNLNRKDGKIISLFRSLSETVEENRMSRKKYSFISILSKTQIFIPNIFEKKIKRQKFVWLYIYIYIYRQPLKNTAQ